jgi:trigger factor
MEVIEHNADGLERRFTVKVPAAELNEKLDARLADIKGRVQLKGFRKGKAPTAHLRKMYGKGIMSEIVQEIINETSYKAFSDRDLKPATQPHPHFSGDMEKIIDGQADLEYSVHAEILPSFEPADFAGLKITRPFAKVADAEVEEALAKIAEQNREYEAKSGKAKSGDQVVIDFVGSIDGEEFEGGKGEEFPLALGSGQFIPGFEDQLIGASAGDDVDVDVEFPDGYGSQSLAGKKARFAVKVREVKAPVEAAVDDAFAQRLGLENLEDLKSRLRERIDAEHRNMARAHVKRALLDKLDAAHSFELPKSMVDAEFAQIWRQVEAAERDEEDKDKTEDQLRDEYRAIAVRRVRLGLVLAEIGRRAEVQVPNDQMQRAIQEAAMRDAQILSMQGQQVTPQQILKFYQQNPSAVAQIRAPLFEERVVDFILEKADVADKEVSKEELMKDPDGEI